MAPSCTPRRSHVNFAVDEEGVGLHPNVTEVKVKVEGTPDVVIGGQLCREAVKVDIRRCATCCHGGEDGAYMHGGNPVDVVAELKMTPDVTHGASGIGLVVEMAKGCSPLALASTSWTWRWPQNAHRQPLRHCRGREEWRLVVLAALPMTS